jgi:hypothetical protein
MSITVELSSLADVIQRFRFAYLMTNSVKGAPRAVAISPVLQGGELVVNGLGRRTRENALERSTVGLVWPPQSEADYSLIVDGEAAVVGESLRITPTRAVLHRPSPASTAEASGSCESDCVELGLTSRSSRTR